MIASAHSQAPANNGCQRCGTCCRKGGPGLHPPDLELVQGGHIGFHQLVTIRQGEFAWSGLEERPAPARREVVKVSGRGREWCCVFLDDRASACGIYAHRPLECRLLKCWQPAALLEVAGRNTLSRWELIPPEEPLRRLVDLQDQHCPAGQVAELLAELAAQGVSPRLLAGLTSLVRQDLALREQAIRDYGLPLAIELFVLGRPLFIQLSQWGIGIREQAGGIILVSR